MNFRTYLAALFGVAALACSLAGNAIAADGPIVATATDVRVAHATLNATVQTGGSGVAVEFDYGTDDGYGHVLGPFTVPDGTDVSVSTDVSPLLPSTTYHFRARLLHYNPDTHEYVTDVTGSDETFTTGESQPPVAATLPASDVTAAEATLHASIDPVDDEATFYRFEYWTGDEPPQTSGGDVGDWADPSAIFADVTGLQADTTYHFRIVALRYDPATDDFTNRAAVGDELTFTTEAEVPPVATTDAATLVSASKATLNGTIVPNNQWVDYRFEWGLTSDYGQATQPKMAGTGSSGLSFSYGVVGLTPATTYHYRIVALKQGTSTLAAVGDDQTFTTRPATGILPYPTGDELAAALAGTPGLVVNGSLSQPPRLLAPAIANEELAGFPTRGSTFAVLTTGDATLADAPHDAAGVDDNGSGVGGPMAYDVSLLRVHVDAPPDANCLSFDVRFLSDEAPAIDGHAGDGFVAELDTPTWITSSGSLENDFAVGPTGDAIAVGKTPMDAVNAVGTGYKSATPLLRAVTPVTPGDHNLYLTIFDQDNASVDSAAFVDDLQALHVAPGGCRAGAAAPGLSVHDASVTEGDAGTTDAHFEVSLWPPTGHEVRVNYATADGSAKQPGDYADTSGILTFTPGEVSKDITVPVRGNTTDQPDRTFSLDLSDPANAVLVQGHATGKIVDDDPAPTPTATASPTPTSTPTPIASTGGAGSHGGPGAPGGHAVRPARIRSVHLPRVIHLRTHRSAGKRADRVVVHGRVAFTGRGSATIRTTAQLRRRIGVRHVVKRLRLPTVAVPVMHASARFSVAISRAQRRTLLRWLRGSRRDARLVVRVTFRPEGGGALVRTATTRVRR